MHYLISVNLIFECNKTAKKMRRLLALLRANKLCLQYRFKDLKTNLIQLYKFKGKHWIKSENNKLLK